MSAETAISFANSSSKITLPYLHSYKDRHGTYRSAYRRSERRGGPRLTVPIRGEHGSDEWYACYERIHESFENERGEPAKEAKREKKAIEKCIESLLGRFYSIKQNAERRSISFTLLRDDFVALADRAKGRCELTNIPFAYEQGCLKGNAFVPSIDRIDSNVGYVYDNCRLVLFSVNAALGPWGEKHLRLIAKSLLKPSTRKLR